MLCFHILRIYIRSNTGFTYPSSQIPAAMQHSADNSRNSLGFCHTFLFGIAFSTLLRNKIFPKPKYAAA